ncbi:cytochrome P450 [Crucibulum laeve]|uniref:Cytochrome P450 n=1 Tax=Crucibulum laeve TaxID=68775 RepID=A0A5C3LUA0_9AGAR|nr:cytochrome P450 [Crucibulum laeve]
MVISVTLGLSCTAVLAYAVYKFVNIIYAHLTSGLRFLPGPPDASFIYGHFKDISSSEDSIIHEEWLNKYGNTMRVGGFLGARQLYTADPKAINHVFMNYFDYQKSEAGIYNIKQLLGPGLILIEGDLHRRQRRILNPAFGIPQIRELTQIFVEKSIQLKDIWAAELSSQGDNSRRVDALSWLNRMTLDIIGLAGFNYEFDALSDEPEKNELNNAFSIMFRAGMKVSPIKLFRGLFPPLRALPIQEDAEVKKAAKTMNRIAAQLLKDSKEGVASSEKNEHVRPGRDILSLLVRANTAVGLPEHQRMTDEQVLAQIPTFLVAGHETTSTSTNWALYALTQNRDAQARLREEVCAVSTDLPTMDELNALPYLDAVVREALRVHAPVPFTMREAMKDDIVPLETPFVGLNGITHNEVRITKGESVMIPLLAVNRSKDIWGEDASEFRPERWFSIPETASTVPGIWGSMLTFIGGPRACIGYRFTLVEMKAILFTLVRAFDFELAVPAKDISKKLSIVVRPVLINESGETVNEMPLLIRPVHRV